VEGQDETARGSVHKPPSHPKEVFLIASISGEGNEKNQIRVSGQQDKELSDA
jgi:hypothetical protein